MSPLQKQHLVTFMTRHRGLGLNAFTCSMGQQKHAELWSQLAQELGEMGPTKTVQQWKITWRDLKRRAKSANAAIYRAHRQTGNSQEIPVLSITDDAILSVIGRTSSEGLPSVPESGLGDYGEQVEETANASAAENLNVEYEGPLLDILMGPESTNRPPAVERRKKKDLVQVYESCTNSMVNVLTDISNHMAEKNNIERERNDILKKKNILIERIKYLTYGTFIG